MTRPLVSIITPTFNRADLLGETLDSLLNQRYADIEVIVVDDGSTDDTPDLLATCRDSRLKVLSRENGGEATATNLGWAAATGTYAAIVSSDDPMPSVWLEELVPALTAHPDVVGVYPDWAIIDEAGVTRKVIRTMEYSLERMVSDFLPLPGPGTLLRKSAGDRLEPLRRQEYRYCSDFDMWLRMALIGPFLRVPKVLATWRDHAGSITVAERTTARADQLVALAHEFLGRADIPPTIALMKTRAVAMAHWRAAWILMPALPQDAERHWETARNLMPGDTLIARRPA